MDLEVVKMPVIVLLKLDIHVLQQLPTPLAGGEAKP